VQASYSLSTFYENMVIRNRHALLVLGKIRSNPGINVHIMLQIITNYDIGLRLNMIYKMKYLKDILLSYHLVDLQPRVNDCMSLL